MSFLEVIKSILFDVSPRDGYFGGIEGFIRVTLLVVTTLAIGAAVYICM
jgi:hypothetical protein